MAFQNSSHNFGSVDSLRNIIYVNVDIGHANGCDESTISAVNCELKFASNVAAVTDSLEHEIIFPSLFSNRT